MYMIKHWLMIIFLMILLIILGPIILLYEKFGIGNRIVISKEEQYIIDLENQCGEFNPKLLNENYERYKK